MNFIRFFRAFAAQYYHLKYATIFYVILIINIDNIFDIFTKLTLIKILQY